MEEKISLTFDEKDRYRLVFSPEEFWRAFSLSYSALTWSEEEGCPVVVAENYTYLVDLLVQARMFYLATKPPEE